jgi:choline-sulfatase
VIDGLAARSTVFYRAYSPSPSTRNAVPALMTARYPSTLNFRKGTWPPKLVPRSHTMLGETFKAAGYRTQAVLCCDEMFGRASGVLDGIDAVDASADKVPNKPADAVAGPARDFLKKTAGAPQPFFLWIHMFDPHDPYVTHPGVESFGKRAIDHYDNEIAYVDAHIAWILEAIVAAGHADDTIVAITADHGEGFDEHGLRTHGNSLYGELLHVPLIIAVPGAAARRVDTPVSTIDLGPTLLDLVGLDRPAGQNGHSLAATVVDGAPPPDRTILSELISIRQEPRSLRAAYHGDWKLLWDQDANTYELFSLADDPLDQHNVIDEHPDVAADMKHRLGSTSDLELTLLPTDKKR